MSLLNYAMMGDDPKRNKGNLPWNLNGDMKLGGFALSQNTTTPAATTKVAPKNPTYGNELIWAIQKQFPGFDPKENDPNKFFTLPPNAGGGNTVRDSIAQLNQMMQDPQIMDNPAIQQLIQRNKARGNVVNPIVQNWTDLSMKAANLENEIFRKIKSPTFNNPEIQNALIAIKEYSKKKIEQDAFMKQYGKEFPNQKMIIDPRQNMSKDLLSKITQLDNMLKQMQHYHEVRNNPLGYTNHDLGENYQKIVSEKQYEDELHNHPLYGAHALLNQEEQERIKSGLRFNAGNRKRVDLTDSGQLKKLYLDMVQHPTFKFSRYKNLIEKEGMNDKEAKENVEEYVKALTEKFGDMKQTIDIPEGANGAYIPRNNTYSATNLVAAGHEMGHGAGYLDKNFTTNDFGGLLDSIFNAPDIRKKWDGQTVNKGNNTVNSADYYLSPSEIQADNWLKNVLLYNEGYYPGSYTPQLHKIFENNIKNTNYLPGFLEKLDYPLLKKIHERGY